MSSSSAFARVIEPVSFGQAALWWLRLGCISFGGPAGQIALMHEELVVRRGWISERRFLHALNFCMVLPGPEAQQLATYLGWLMHRTRGGIVAGSLFVLPSFFVLVGLSWVYMAFGSVPAVSGFLDGMKPAVTAIVAVASARIGARTLTNGGLRALAIAAFLALAVGGWPFPLVMLAAGCVGWAGGRWAPETFTRGPGAERAVGDEDAPPPPHTRFSRQRFRRVLVAWAAIWTSAFGALVIAFGRDTVLPQMAWFFTKAALLTFGGAYAVLPYVIQGAVAQHHWLSAPQMIDGLALGETTPGPLVMVVAFVGFVGGWTRSPLGAAWPFLAGAVAARVQPVVATQDCIADAMFAANTSAGVRQFKIFRGRLFSAIPTATRSL